MKTLVIDGSHQGDPTAAAVAAAVRAHLPDARTLVARTCKIGNCAGCFSCWVRTPGMCRVDDDNRLVAAESVRSDLAVLLTPITFGGYSSALKRPVDHLIQNISPFFTSIDGEIHHQRRYPAYPDLLVIGWGEAPSARAEAIFRHLVRRNAINLYADTAVCGVVAGRPSQRELVSQTKSWVDAVIRHSGSPAGTLPDAGPDALEASPVRRAVLLVGSPRTRRSTSYALGSHLMKHLGARGVQTQVVQIHTTMASAARRGPALAALDVADLVVLAFPVYVDSLPAPVIAALERIAEHRTGRTAGQHWAAIVNCGFPEVAHNATAVAICAEFAHQSGFAWAGGLALGGGEGLVHGRPLDELGGRGTGLRKALELTAESLAAGGAVPRRAQQLFDRTAVPRSLYKLVGGYGWRREARRYGMARDLRSRPYESYAG